MYNTKTSFLCDKNHSKRMLFLVLAYENHTCTWIGMLLWQATVWTESKLTAVNLFFVRTVDKFQIPEYSEVQIFPKGPVTMLILPPTWNAWDCSCQITAAQFWPVTEAEQSSLNNISEYRNHPRTTPIVHYASFGNHWGNTFDQKF